MTIICAMNDGKGVWLGSDTEVSMGDDKFDVGPKWLFAGRWALGHTGSCRTSQCHSQNKLTLAKISEPIKLINRLRDIMTKDGFERKKAEQTIMYGCNWILTDGGNLWAVSANFCLINVPPNRFYASGCGEEYAKGASTAIKSFSKPKDMMIAAVSAAIELDPQCGGDVWVQYYKAQKRPRKKRPVGKAMVAA